jgi:L-ascorbate metabolism protein UlaG (beta-lactamase superfamily)
MNGLIQPLKQGEALVEEIASTAIRPGAMGVWWLGQSGFLLKSRQGIAVIDPYLSEHLTAKYANSARPHVRMTEAPLRGGDLQGVHLILGTHKHSDHLDPGTLPGLMAASPRARLVVPQAIADHAIGLGLPAERVCRIDAGQVSDVAGFRIRAIPSAHEGLDTDSLGRHLYLGYVIEADGLRLYHSGDCVVYEGLEAELGPEPFDVMFLPINGRDPARGVAGNMSAAEAVDLASRCRPRFVVPHHYDMFTFNTVPVAVFETEARRLPEGVTARILLCGERWILEGRGAA